jgi:hypothetical protein
LKGLLVRAGFAVTMRAGFAETRGFFDTLIAQVRRIAVAARLIPHTMAGKTLLKRLFYGSLAHIPRELEAGRHRTEPLASIGSELDLRRYRTLYAEARKVSK